MNSPFLPPPNTLHVSFLVVLAAFSLLARPALSSPPALSNGSASNAADRPIAWIPDTTRLVDIADEVASFSPQTFAERAASGQASAESCTLGDEGFSCRCVTIDTENATYRALSWQRRGDDVIARQLSVRQKRAANSERYSSEHHSSENYYVGKWRVDAHTGDESRGQQHVLEPVIFTRPRGQIRTLEAAGVELLPAGQNQSLKVEIDTLRWHREDSRLRDASCGTSWPQPLDEPALTASWAGLGDTGWVFRGFDLARTTVHLAEFQADAPGPVSGFLPPTLIYSDEIASLQASYLLAGLGVAPQAVVAPTYWYGLGFGLVSYVEDAPDRSPALADETTLLDAQLRWSEEADGVRPAVLGDGFWGAPYTHLSASVEEVGHRRFWSVDRFRRDAPFRPWRLSRAGVSLSGPTHVLSLQVLHTEALDDWETFGARPEPRLDVLGANFLLATHHELDQKSRADLEVEHSSFLTSGTTNLTNDATGADTTSHATTVRVGAERIVGSRGALYVEPALRAWLQSSRGSQSVGAESDASSAAGIDTSIRSQVVATVDAGAALRGRFGGVTHRIEPGVVLAREVVGFSRGDVIDAGGLGAQAGTLIEREDGFSLGAIRLDQGLTVGPNLSLEMPLALVFEGAGLVEAVETAPWAIGGLAVRRDGLEVGLRAACARLCDEQFWTASAAVEVGSFDLLYMGGDLRRETLSALTWRSSMHDGWAMVHGFQQGAAHTDGDEAAHLAGVGWRRGRLGAQVRAYYQATRDDLGVSVGNTYAFPELGWAVGVRAAIGSGAQGWGVLIGLAPSG